MLFSNSNAEASVQTPRKRGKRKKWLILLAVILAAVLLLLLLLPKKDASAARQSLYTTEAVSRRDIVKTISGSGSLKPANSYTVVTLVEGDVLKADFEEGDMVKKDTVLYEIDSSDASTNIEKAQIALNQARRNYENTAEKKVIKAPVSGSVYELNVSVGDEVTPGQPIVTVRDSSVMTLKVPFPAGEAAAFAVGQAAVVTLDSTFETLPATVKEISGTAQVGAGNRMTRNVTVEVKNPGGLTEKQAASAEVGGVSCTAGGTFRYKAQGSVSAAVAGTVLSVSAPEGTAVKKDDTILTLGGSDLDDMIQGAADSLRNAELSMESVQELLENYSITSPIEGTIVDKQYKTGDTVESGKVLCTIYDLSYLEMTLNIDELDISELKVGQNVRITADAVEGKTYEGAVTKVSVAGSTVGGTTVYPVTIRLDKTEGLLPGMNVDAELVTAEKKGVLSIPAGAVSRGGAVLVTADSPSAKNALERKAPEGYVYVKAELGVMGDDHVEVLAGLQEGDTVAYVAASTQSGYMAMFGAMGGPMGGGMQGGRPAGAGGPRS